MTDFWIQDYGANVNNADNQSQITAAINAAVAAGGSPNHRVRIPVGMFKHSNRIYALVSIIGTNSDPARGPVSGLYATGEVRSVNIDGTKTAAKQIIIEHLHLTGTGVSRSPGTPSKNAILIEKGASNFIIRNNFIQGPNELPDGGDSTPQIGGIFMHSVHDGLVQRNTCRYTSADSIHITGGSASYNIIVEYNRVEFPGDDTTAMVTYGLGAQVKNCISRYNTSFRSRNGRCFTSIGSVDSKIYYNYGENTSQTVPTNKGGKAAVMVGAESAYNSPGSFRLHVYRNTFLQTGGTTSGHGSIHQYVSSYTTADLTWAHKDNTYEDNQIISPRRSGMVFDGNDAGTNIKVLNNKVYGLNSGQVAVELRPSTIAKRNWVETGTVVSPLSAWSTAKPHAIKNIGGAYTTARHPADPLYNGEEPVPEPPVDPPVDPVDPTPDPLPAGAVSRTITTVSGTLLRQSTPDTSYGTAALWTVDGDNPAASAQKDITILKFDNLIGSGATQVPPNATIHSAVLKLQTTDGGHSATMHKMLVNWTAAATWNSLTAGVVANDIEASSIVEATTGTTVPGVTSIDVKSSVQDWADGSPNNGWVFIPLPGSTDGWTFYGSAGTTPPKLEVVYIPGTVVVEPPPPVSKVVVTGRATTGANTVTFVAPNSEIILRFSDTLIDAATVSNITFTPEHETDWTTGGPGTVTLNGDDVSLTGTGGAPTFAFRALDVELDTMCRVVFQVATNQVSVKLGIAAELMSQRTALVGTATYDFPSIIQPILYFERIPLGTSNITGLTVTQLAPHVWSFSGPGTVTITDNATVAMVPLTNTTFTMMWRPFGAIPKREYLVSYTQAGGDLTRNMGDTTASGTAVSNTATSPVGNNSLRVWARSNQMYLRFYRNTVSSAITITNLTAALIPFELATTWTTVGSVVLNPESNSATMTSDGVTAASVTRSYNTHATATYAMSFSVTGGDVTYSVGSTAGGVNLVAATAAASGTTVSITFTGGVGTTFLRVTKSTAGTATVSRPDIDLFVEPVA